jgi:hypothetical protein
MGSCFSSTVDERPAVYPQPYTNTGKAVSYEQQQYTQQQYAQQQYAVQQPYAQTQQYVYAQPQQYIYAQQQPQYVYAQPQPQYVQQAQPQYYGQPQQMSTGTAIVGGMVAGAVLQEVLFD